MDRKLSKSFHKSQIDCIHAFYLKYNKTNGDGETTPVCNKCKKELGVGSILNPVEDKVYIDTTAKCNKCKSGLRCMREGEF